MPVLNPGVNLDVLRRFLEGVYRIAPNHKGRGIYVSSVHYYMGIFSEAPQTIAQPCPALKVALGARYLGVMSRPWLVDGRVVGTQQDMTAVFVEEADVLFRIADLALSEVILPPITSSVAETVAEAIAPLGVAATGSEPDRVGDTTEAVLPSSG